MDETIVLKDTSNWIADYTVEAIIVALIFSALLAILITAIIRRFR